MPTDKTVITPNANILNVTLSPTNGSFVAQIGDVTNEDVENYEAQWVQQSGFASIPPNAVPNATASEAVVLHTEYRDYVVACRDFNTQNNYGNLGPGEFCLYSAGADGSAQAKIVGKSNSSITLYTTDSGKASGNGVYFQVSPTAFRWVAPWGSIVFDANGFQVNTISGAGFNLGGLAAAGPLSSVIGNFCNITASNTSIASPFISLGDGINTPVVSSMLPLTIASTVITLSTPALMLGDVTTPMNMVAPSLLTVTASAGIAVQSGGPVGITSTAVAITAAATQITGTLNVTGAVILEGIAMIVGVLSSPLVPAPGIVTAFIQPG